MAGRRGVVPWALVLFTVIGLHVAAAKTLDNAQPEEPPQGTVVFEGEGGKITCWGPVKDLLLTAGEMVIEPQGLFLPMYASCSSLVYVMEGAGRMGLSYPFGFPSNARRVKKGDVFAVPAGWAFWLYNDQGEKLHTFAACDVSTASQPGSAQAFHLMGAEGGNASTILSGFTKDFAAAAWDIPETMVDQLLKAQTGSMIVKAQLPGANDVREAWFSNQENDNAGLLNFVYNLEETEPDFKVERGGFINFLTRDKLKILKEVGLGATLFHLEKGAIIPPGWYTNAGSVGYVVKGGAKVQIASAEGKPLYDKDVKVGELLVFPYMTPAITIAGEEGLDLIEFQTSSSIEMSFLIGVNGLYSSLPTEVLQAGFNVDENVVKELKEHHKDEAVIFPPKPVVIRQVIHRLRKFG